MPILEVEIVGGPERPALAQKIADAAAEVFLSKPSNTWVKLYYLSDSQYAENSAPAGQPVFVKVSLGQSLNVRTPAEAARELTLAFAKILERPPESIHIIFEPSLVGRIAFGGKLLT